MTSQIMSRFSCNRCRDEEDVPHNDQPSQYRGAAPETWLAIRYEDPMAPPIHLCPKCRADFEQFLATILESVN